MTSSSGSVSPIAELVEATAKLRSRVSPAILAVLAAGVALFVLAAITTPAFFSLTNARVIVGAAALTGVAAIGLTFVTLSGNFVSLSIEQTAAICAITLGLLVGRGWMLAPALSMILLLALTIGVVQGVMVGLGSNPIIVTLAAGAALQGLAAILSGGRQLNFNHEGMAWLGNLRPLGMPVEAYAFILLTVVAGVFLRRHRAGRMIALTGENRAAATSSGFPTFWITVLVFVLSSATAALVALLSASAYNLANIDQFHGLTFNAIAAVLVGGTSIRGGDGSVLRTGLGAVFIAMLANVMLLRDWPFGVRQGVVGLVVILAVSGYHVMSQPGGRT